MRRLQTSRRRRGFALLDVIVGGVMLAIGLGAVLSVTGRSMSMQRYGEHQVVASWLADELLSMVLVEGPDQYPKLHDTNGQFTGLFEQYGFNLDIKNQGIGLPYRVTATVHWGDADSQQVQVETLIALRLGDPEQLREPYEPVDRDDRYFGEDDE